MPAAAWPHPVDPYRPASLAPSGVARVHRRARLGDRHARSDGALTIRRAGPADAATLATLAALDSARPLEGEALIALQDERPVAALELSGGRGVADPFRPSDEALGMLRIRARQLAVAARPDTRRAQRGRAISRIAQR